jgi:CHAD domain-containing protein
MDEVKEIATRELSPPDVSEGREEDQSSPSREAPEKVVAAPLDKWPKVRELATKQLDRFMSFEPQVLRGNDPDAIHDMRVASRRLQQILDLLYPKPRQREIRSLRRKIRRSRRSLSEVRNCDVLVEYVNRRLARKQAAGREVWTAVGNYLRERRVQSFEKALAKLSKVHLAVFYLRLKPWLELRANTHHRHQHAHPPAGAEELPPEQFYERVGESLNRLWRNWYAQLAQSQRDWRPPVIHGVRIATKRLRYLIEVIAAFELEGSAEVLAWLRGLQQGLGDWHDLEVLEQMMIEMVARPDFLRDHLDLAMAVEKLILKNRRFKKDFQEKYFRITLHAPEVERLRQWVGYVLESPSAAFAAA